MSTQTVASGVVELIPSAKGFGAAVNRELSGDLARAGESGGRKAGSALGGSLAKWGKRAAAGAAVGIGATFGTALVKGFGRLKAIEEAEAKLTGLGHSAETVEKIMGNASAAVKGTAFGLGDAASAAASAVASGVKPGEDLERTLKLMGDASAIAGTEFGDMASIFNKVSAGGVIQGEELAQLGDRGIPILQLLADELGVSAQEVKKLASEGKIGFEDFQNAMEAGMGGAALESGKTFQGAMNNVGAALGRLGADLLSGVFPKIAPMLQNVIGWLDKMGPVAKVAGESLGSALEWAGQAIGTLVENFRQGEGPMGVLRSAMEGLWSAAKVLFDYVVSTVVPALASMYQWFKDNWSVVVTVGAAVLAYNGYMLLLNATTKAVTLATTIWTGVQKALNLVMRLNPIGLIIAAIAGLIAIVIIAYRENDKFRAVVDKAWAGIKSAISATVTWFTGMAWPWMRNALQWIGDKALWLWSSAISPAFSFIWDKVKAVGAWVKDTLWPWMRDAFSNIATKAGDLKDKAVRAFDLIRSGVSSAWDGAKKILDRFKAGLDSLRDKFGRVKDGIASIWGTITGAIAGPINKVIGTINTFTQNLASKLSQIPGVSISIPKIPNVAVPAQGGYGSGYQPGRYADGGMVRGPWRGPKADNVLGVDSRGVPTARVNPREMVLSVAGTSRLLRKVGMGGLNMLNRGELPGFAGGGLVGGSLGDALAGAGSWLLDMFTNPGKALKGLADKALSGLGGSWAGQGAIGAVGESMKKLAAWVKDKVFGGEDASGGGGSFSGGAMYWPAIWAMVKTIAPEARMTSNYRRGATTAGYGNASLHSLRRAIDIVSPNMVATALKLLKHIPRPNEFIHTPLGGLQYSRGGRRTGNFAPITRAQHYDHIHIGYADGGLVKPFVADSGALLRPGLNVLDNRTGGPEPLGRLDRPLDLSEETVDAILDGIEARMTGNRRALVRELVTSGRSRVR